MLTTCLSKPEVEPSGSTNIKRTFKKRKVSGPGKEKRSLPSMH